MRINSEETYSCISKMKNTKYYEKWLAIRDFYAPELNNGPIVKPKAYTPHDYDRHCIDLYRIISAIIDHDDGIKNTIGIENLFVLNVAVIMHDIGMIKTPRERNRHNEESAKYIENQMKTRTILHQNINRDQADCLKRIVIAHCDYKNDDGTKTGTFDQLISKNNYLPSEQDNYIDERLLAGLLRLADELDMISNRLSGISFDDGELQTNDPEDIISIDHWRKCQLFSWPSIDVENRILYLNPSSSINDIDWGDGSIQYKASLISDVLLKVQDEMRGIIKNCFLQSKIYPSLLTNIDIKLNTNFFQINGELSTSIEEEYRIKSLVNNIPKNTENASKNTENASKEPQDKKKPEIPVTGQKAKEIEINLPEIISQDFEVKLQEYVILNGLLESGHFSLTNKEDKVQIHVRDWLNTQAIVENRSIMLEICETFIGKIKEFKNIDLHNLCLVGIDIQGMIIASIISLRLGCSFSYLVPDRIKGSFSEKEKEIRINKQNKFILITDSIATGSTINGAIEILIKKQKVRKNNLFGIFTIFLRNEIKSEGKLINNYKVFALSKMFPIEFCRKDPQSCIFNNKLLNVYDFEY